MEPRFIRTDADFSQAVILGTTIESLYLEFKESVDGWGAKNDASKSGQKEICRDIAQFANSFGGCLLLGVKEKKNIKGAFSTANTLQSLKDPSGLVQWIEQAIKNYLVPSMFRHEIVPLNIQGHNLIAINIPANREIISLWVDEDGTIEYVHRTNHGKAHMNPDEAEKHKMDGSRSAKIAFHHVRELAGPISCDEFELAGPFWKIFGPNFPNTPPERWEPKTNTLKVIDTNHSCIKFEVDTGQGLKPFIVPFSLIREIWLGANAKPVMLLSARPVFYAPNSFGLEPL